MATLNEERIKEKKRKKRKTIFLMTLGEIILAVWMTNIGTQIMNHVFFERGKEMAINLSLILAIKTLVTERINLYIFLLIECLYFYYLIMVQNPYTEKVEKVDTFFVTPEIEKPVPAGNGQHGSERFLREDEKERLYKKIEWTGDIKEIDVNDGGIIVNYRREGKKEILYYIGAETHTLIIAASGGGKTRRVLLGTIFLQIMSGISSLISDVKGELYYYTSKFAESMGVLTLGFNLRNPRKSVHYNFMQPILDAFENGDEAKAIDYTWDLVGVLVGEKKGEPLWYNGESASIAACVLIVALNAPEEYRNLTNVYFFLAYMCKTDEYGEMPINNYIARLPDTHPAKGVFMMAQLAPYKTRSSFFTSALGTLRLFTNPSIAEMTSKSDFRLEDIVKKKSMLYMMIPDEKKTYYPIASLLITQFYCIAVDVADRNGGITPVPVDMNLDEVGNFPFIPVLGGICSAGRSRGIRANLVIQDEQQMESKYKEDYRNIRTNCKNKIFLQSDDETTLKRISEDLGEYTVESGSVSNSVSGKSAGTDGSVSISSSANLTGCKLLSPAELSRFKNPYALCLLTGEYGAVNNLPDLSEHYCNEIFGLGDKEHNRKIIMERDAGIPERTIPPVQLWGIWNQLKKKEEKKEEVKMTSFLG